MTNREIESRLKEMREIRARTFPDFMKNPVIDGKEITWKEFNEEESNLRKMYLEIMKKEDGWYTLAPVKEVCVENGKIVVGICKKYNDYTDHNLMLVYKMVKNEWDKERPEYSGREIQSDEYGIYLRVKDGATPDEINNGTYHLREVTDTGTFHGIEEIYAELIKESSDAESI